MAQLPGRREMTQDVPASREGGDNSPATREEGDKGDNVAQHLPPTTVSTCLQGEPGANGHVTTSPPLRDYNANLQCQPAWVSTPIIPASTHTRTWWYPYP